MSNEQNPTELERFNLGSKEEINEYPSATGSHVTADNALAIAAERDANAAEIATLKAKIIGVEKELSVANEWITNSEESCIVAMNIQAAKITELESKNSGLSLMVDSIEKLGYYWTGKEWRHE